LNLDSTQFKATTDEQGRFSFDFVPPGERQLVRLIPMGARSRMHSHGEWITVRPGETTRLVFGGKGRPIIGRFVLDDSKVAVDWSNGHFSLGTRFPTPLTPLRTREEVTAWNNSPEVKEARKNHRSYGLKVNADGTFRVENVPAGTYSMHVTVNEPGQEQFSARNLGFFSREVEVPEIPGGVSDEPLDLGTLTVKTTQRR